MPAPRKIVNCSGSAVPRTTWAYLRTWACLRIVHEIDRRVRLSQDGAGPGPCFRAARGISRVSHSTARDGRRDLRPTCIRGVAFPRYTRHFSPLITVMTWKRRWADRPLSVSARSTASCERYRIVSGRSTAHSCDNVAIDRAASNLLCAYFLKIFWGDATDLIIRPLAYSWEFPIRVLLHQQASLRECS